MMLAQWWLDSGLQGVSSEMQGGCVMLAQWWPDSGLQGIWHDVWEGA